MPFRIVPRKDLSLAELLELHRRGCYVVKTPHVGNQYPNNLAIAWLGIPMLLVDQTIGGKDRNFHPHLVIACGKSERVSDPDRLTSHARVTRGSEWFPDRFAVGASLAEAHVRALRDAFPDAPIETTSGRTARFADLMVSILETLTGLWPDAWRRKVGPGGVLSEPSPPRSWKEVMRDGVHGLSADGCGWIIPNAWNILCDGVIGVRQTGHDVVYELSGPDMIRYYPDLVPEIDAGYEAVRGRLGLGLPETLTMAMVSVADMRFVTTRGRAARLDALVASYLRLDAFNRKANARIAALSGHEKAAVIKVVTRDRGLLQDAVRDAVGECPEIFYQIAHANCLTQYDLLGGEELYVSPWGVEASIDALETAMKMLGRYAPKSQSKT